MENIKNEIAFRQKYDTNPLNVVQKSGTDIDWVQPLPNNLIIINEWKKDTLNHTVENIINTPQWTTIRALAGEKHYAIYSTHNEEISDQDISTDKLIVRYVELNKQPIVFPVGITLKKYENALGSIGMYYIKVKYPQGNEEFALISPKENDNWTSTQYWSNNNAFKSEEDCLEYIKKRYEKEFNQSYIYSIYYVESISSVKLVHRYTYAEIIGL